MVQGARQKTKDKRLLMEELKYNVIFSRRRSISIILSPDKGIIVRAPYRASLKTIDSFVQQKSGWINKHLNNYQGLTRINHNKRYSDGELHMFLGKKKILKITESARSCVSQNNDIIEVSLSETDDREKIKALLERWYREKAVEIFSRKLHEILTRYGVYNFSPSGFVIKPLKSRWGSCTSKGKITLNSGLVKLDEIFSDYVIIHELCHLRYHNHGKEYYRLLGELVPDYKSIRKELRKYITK
jgi:predicted metal-dependent hydrolase